MTNTELVRQLQTASIQADEMRLRDFGYLMKCAADAIEDLENKLNLWRHDKISHWIPVTERLPEHTAIYLVSVGVNYGGEGEHPEVMTALFRPWNGDFSVDYDRSIRGPIVGDVTHWMPLPNPPEKGTEE